MIGAKSRISVTSQVCSLRPRGHLSHGARTFPNLSLYSINPILWNSEFACLDFTRAICSKHCLHRTGVAIDEIHMGSWSVFCPSSRAPNLMRSVHSRDCRTDELAHNVRKGLPTLTKVRHKKVLPILKKRNGKGANYDQWIPFLYYLRAIAIPPFKKEEQMTTICRTSGTSLKSILIPDGSIRCSGELKI